MPRLSLAGASDLVNLLGSKSKPYILLIMLVGAGVTGVTTVKSFGAVPGAIAKHTAETRILDDSIIMELRRIRKLDERASCLEIARLRHADWTPCVLPAPVQVQ